MAAKEDSTATGKPTSDENTSFSGEITENNNRNLPEPLIQGPICDLSNDKTKTKPKSDAIRRMIRSRIVARKLGDRDLSILELSQSTKSSVTKTSTGKKRGRPSKKLNKFNDKLNMSQESDTGTSTPTSSIRVGSKRKDRSPPDECNQLDQSNSEITSTNGSLEPLAKKNITSVQLYTTQNTSLSEPSNGGNASEEENLIIKHLRGIETRLDNNHSTVTTQISGLETTVNNNHSNLTKRLDSIETTVNNNKEFARKEREDLESRLSQKITENKGEMADLRTLISNNTESIKNLNSDDKATNALSPKSFAHAVKSELKQQNFEKRDDNKSPWFLNVFIHGVAKKEGEKVPKLVEDLLAKSELNIDLRSTTLMFRARRSYIPGQDPPIFLAFNSGPVRNQFIRSCDKICKHDDYKNVTIRGDRDPVIKQKRHKVNMVINYNLSRNKNAYLSEGILHIDEYSLSADLIDQIIPEFLPPVDYQYNKELKRKLHKPHTEKMELDLESLLNKSPVEQKKTPTLDSLSPTRYNQDHIETVPMGFTFNDQSSIHINTSVPVTYQGHTYQTARHLYECLRARTIGALDTEKELQEITDLKEMLQHANTLVDNSKWKQKREKIYELSLDCLMNQSDICRAILLSTKRHQLIYANTDLYWGGGENMGSEGSECYKLGYYEGKNTVGIITVRVRDKHTRKR